MLSTIEVSMLATAEVCAVEKVNFTLVDELVVYCDDATAVDDAALLAEAISEASW